MLLTSVLNSEECGFNLVNATFGYLYGFRGLRSKKLQIEHVRLVQNNGSIKDGGNFGWRAFLHLFSFEPPTIDVELDIYLVGGTVVEVRTTDSSIIRAVVPYMQLKDPREKSRKLRRQEA